MATVDATETSMFSLRRAHSSSQPLNVLLICCMLLRKRILLFIGLLCDQVWYNFLW